MLTWYLGTIRIGNGFRAYRTCTVDIVQDTLELLREEHATFVEQSLSLLALRERRDDALKLCLDLGGFTYEEDFVAEANQVEKDVDPEIYRILKKSEFRHLHPRPARPETFPAPNASEVESGTGGDYREG